MKRIVSLALFALVLVGSLAAPVSASEIAQTSYINVLDYATANDSGGNYVRYENGTKVNYKLIGSYSIIERTILIGYLPLDFYVFILERNLRIPLVVFPCFCKFLQFQ